MVSLDKHIENTLILVVYDDIWKFKSLYMVIWEHKSIKKHSIKTCASGESVSTEELHINYRLKSVNKV